MTKHLAVFSREGLEAIFNGQKTIETRFSKNRIAPFGVINSGDIVYLKPSGQDVVGQFTVKKVISFDSLSTDDWQLIKEHYWSNISFGNLKLDQTFIKQHQDASFASLIFIDKLERFITSPIKIYKRDHRGWLVLD